MELPEKYQLVYGNSSKPITKHEPPIDDVDKVAGELVIEYARTYRRAVRSL